MKAYKGGKASDNKSDADPNLVRLLQKHEIEGKKLSINESEVKYSAMLLELVKPYHGAVPQIDEMEWLLDIAIVSWNISNMKKVVPQAYKIMLQETKNDFNGDRQAIQLLEKLVKDKDKKFAQHDMFIQDFELKDSANGKFYVTVTAKPLESFLTDTVSDEDAYEAADYNDVPAYINRNAFSIIPKQPFSDWLSKAEEDLLSLLESTPPTIYLVEEKDSEDEMEKWLKKNFDTLFKKELEAWYVDEKLWPKNRTYSMFRDWFAVVCHSMLYDLEAFPVDKDMP